jgi:hypothetical protein
MSDISRLGHFRIPFDAGRPPELAGTNPHHPPAGRVYSRDERFRHTTWPPEAWWDGDDGWRPAGFADWTCWDHLAEAQRFVGVPWAFGG